jgi:hypothetical protein
MMTRLCYFLVPSAVPIILKNSSNFIQVRHHLPKLILIPSSNLVYPKPLCSIRLTNNCCCTINLNSITTLALVSIIMTTDTTRTTTEASESTGDDDHDVVDSTPKPPKKKRSTSHHKKKKSKKSVVDHDDDEDGEAEEGKTKSASKKKKKKSKKHSHRDHDDDDDESDYEDGEGDDVPKPVKKKKSIRKDRSQKSLTDNDGAGMIEALVVPANAIAHEEEDWDDDVEGGTPGRSNREYITRTTSALAVSADPFAAREGKTLIWRNINMTLVRVLWHRLRVPSFVEGPLKMLSCSFRIFRVGRARIRWIASSSRMFGGKSPRARPPPSWAPAARAKLPC